MQSYSPRSGLLPLAQCEPGPRGPELVRVPTAVTADQLSLDDLLAEPPATRSTAPSPELESQKLHWLLTALLEIYAGRRPVAQISGWLAPALQGLLRDRARASGPRYTLRKIHTCHTAQGVVEVCGTAHTSRRAYAVTARFQYESEGWHCVAFTVLDMPTPGAATARLARR